MQENTAKTATEWVFVAKSIAQMPEGQSQALRCMVRAVIVAQDVADWLTVAKAWAQDFNDAEMTQSCMGKAESTAEGSGDWKLVADTWSEMGNYERAIDWRKKLSSAEPQMVNQNFASLPAPDNTDLDNFFEDDEDDFPDFLHADCKEFISTAKELIEADYGEALRYIAQAEAIACIALDWTAIAKCWAYDFKDPDNARRCIEQAEIVAISASDWILIADCWAEEFRDSNNQTRCVLKAGDATKNVSDWMLIAKYHIKKYPVADGLEDCFYQAELLANSSYDWNLIERTANEPGWTYRANAARRRITLEQYIERYVDSF